VASKNPQATVIAEKWKEFEIEVFRDPEQVQDLRLLTFNAQVPLKPEAVQITVIGEASREDQLRAVLQSVLSNLDGQTNWLNTQQRVTRLAEGLTRLAITVGVLVAIAVVVWRWVRRRGSRGRAEPGAAAGGGRVPGS
jgi:hypothetical protein